MTYDLYYHPDDNPTDDELDEAARSMTERLEATGVQVSIPVGFVPSRDHPRGKMSMVAREDWPQP